MTKRCPKVHFVLPIWGERYTDVFLSISLPSLLTPGNIRNERFKGSVLEIYSNIQSIETIKKSEIFSNLSKLLDVYFIDIQSFFESSNYRSKWSAFRFATQEAVRSAEAANAVIVLLCSDQLWTPESLSRAIAHVDAGMDLVACAGPRTIEEDVRLVIERDYFDAQTNNLTIDTREIVRLGLRHLHPEMKAWSWDLPEYYLTPVSIFFFIENGDIVSWPFSLHPVCIFPQVKGQTDFKVIDQDFLLRAIPDRSKVYVSRDSDDIFHFELSPRDASVPPAPHEAAYFGDRYRALSWYGEGIFNAMHLEFAKAPIRIHANDVVKDEWKPQEERANQIFEIILQDFMLSDAYLAERLPENLYRRIERRCMEERREPTQEENNLLEIAEQHICPPPPAPDVVFVPKPKNRLIHRIKNVLGLRKP